MPAEALKKIYDRKGFLIKVPLFDAKSGTLLIEKRYFTSRKAVLFLFRIPKALCVSDMR